MTDDTTPPITVPAAPTQTMVDTGIGQIVQAAGGVILAYGVFTPQHWAAIASALVIIPGALWRLYAAFKHWQAAHTVAADPRVPDEVAKVAAK